MNEFMVILPFAAGVILGASVLAWHYWSVRHEVERIKSQADKKLAKLQAAYNELQENAGAFQQASDCADAFRRGKSAGRADPMTQAERFAQTFEGKRAKFVDTSKRGEKAQ